MTVLEHEEVIPLCLGARVRQRRKAMQLSVEELATATGLPVGSITRIESGYVHERRRLNVLADALQVTPQWLRHGGPELDGLGDEAIEVALAWRSLNEESRAALACVMQCLANVEHTVPEGLTAA